MNWQPKELSHPSSFELLLAARAGSSRSIVLQTATRVIAAEIVEDLQAALEELGEIQTELGK